MTTVKTIPELSKESGVSEYTLRQLCRTGKLPYLRIGNRWLIKVSDFEALFKRNGNENS